MANTAVLRFRDVEAETVEVHREIIDQTGAVWWAWWKKESEDGKIDALSELADACPIDIGLINREKDTRFIAKCTRIAYSPDGTPLSTPEAARTPAYYRGDAFPAWFLFSSIESVTADQWNRQFGPIPVGEPTLFLIPMNQAAQARAILSKKYSRDPVGIRSPVILHLSDLHFGTDFGFMASRPGGPTQQTLHEAIVQGLAQMGVPPVGLLVISGDITTRGQNDGFLEAQFFLSRLLPSLELSTEQVVIVPGNHDILLEDPQLTRSYSAEQPFRNFLELVCDLGKLELNRLHWFSLSDGRDIIVLALNSIRLRSDATKEYGYIGRDLYGPLVVEAGELSNEVRDQQGIRPLSMAVLHHHVLPTPLVEEPEATRPVSLTLDAGQLIEDLQRANVGVILHGHQHIPFVGTTSRACRNQSGEWAVARPVNVIGGGSCGVKAERLWNQMRNNCLGVYTVGKDSMNVKMYQYAPGVEFQELLNLNVPLGLDAGDGVSATPSDAGARR
jgi:calcineurin-like phosphoesterase family protein